MFFVCEFERKVMESDCEALFERFFGITSPLRGYELPGLRSMLKNPLLRPGVREAEIPEACPRDPRGPAFCCESYVKLEILS
jgi:hypothetical protein